jgi:hypothetical protein
MGDLPRSVAGRFTTHAGCPGAPIGLPKSRRRIPRIERPFQDKIALGEFPHPPRRLRRASFSRFQDKIALGEVPPPPSKAPPRFLLTLSGQNCPGRGPPTPLEGSAALPSHAPTVLFGSSPAARPRDLPWPRRSVQARACADSVLGGICEHMRRTGYRDFKISARVPRRHRWRRRVSPTYAASRARR